MSAERCVTFFLLENKIVDPFRVKREIEAVVRRENPNIIKNRGCIIVRDVDEEEISALGQVKDLGGCAVRVKLPAPANPITRVVIVGVEQGIDTETIVKHSECLSAHRIIKRFERGDKITSAVILDYPENKVPAFVFLSFYKFRTRTYVRPPVRCYKCQLYGHVAKHCTRKDKYARCSGEPDTRTCQDNGEPKKICASCNGEDHPTGDAECPRRTKAKTINTTMAREGWTYAQAARNLRRNKTPNTGIDREKTQPQETPVKNAVRETTRSNSPKGNKQKIQIREKVTQENLQEQEPKTIPAVTRQKETQRQPEKSTVAEESIGCLIKVLIILIETLMARPRGCGCTHANTQPIEENQTQAAKTTQEVTESTVEVIKKTANKLSQMVTTPDHE